MSREKALKLYGKSADIDMQIFDAIGSIVHADLEILPIKDHHPNNTPGSMHIYPVLETPSGYATSFVRIAESLVSFGCRQTFAAESLFSEKFDDVSAAVLEHLLHNFILNEKRGEAPNVAAFRVAIKNFDDVLLHRSFFGGAISNITDIAVFTYVGSLLNRNLLSPENCHDVVNFKRWWMFMLHNKNLERFACEKCLSQIKNSPSCMASSGSCSANSTRAGSQNSCGQNKSHGATACSKKESAHDHDDDNNEKAPASSDGGLQWDELKRRYQSDKPLPFAERARHFFDEIYNPATDRFFRMKYEKLPNECKVGFITRNGVTGYLSRMPASIRKQGFAVILITGTDGNFDVEGLFMFRSETVPEDMKEHAAYEYYPMVKLDAVKDRQVISQFLFYQSTDTVDGKPIYHGELLL